MRFQLPILVSVAPVVPPVKSTPELTVGTRVRAMINVPKLKEKARLFEQEEKWREALETYERAINDSEGEESGLWNRVGDLHIRLGQTDRAVSAYEHAVDVYAESGLHNNAIALCNKILRVVPDRIGTYHRLGKLSAQQGFLADARYNFLQFAERMQRAGDLESSFAALREFVDLSPDDVDGRRLLAEQLESHGHLPEAIEQFQVVVRLLEDSGRYTDAEELGLRIRSLDPEGKLGGEAGPFAGEAQAAEEVQPEDSLPAFSGWESALVELSPSTPESPSESAAEDTETELLDAFEIYLGPTDGAPATEISPLEGLEPTQQPEGELEEVSDALPFLDASTLEPAAEWSVGTEPAPEPFAERDPEYLSSSIEYEAENTHPDELVELEVVGFVESPIEEEDAEVEQDSPEPLPLLGFGDSSTDEISPSLDHEELWTPDLSDAGELATPELIASPETVEESRLDQLRTRVAAAPTDAVAREELLRLLGERGEREEAEEVLRNAHQALAQEERFAEAHDIVRALLNTAKPGIALLQQQVEYAFRAGETGPLIRAYLELARHLEAEDSAAKAAVVYRRVLELDPGQEEARRALASPRHMPPPSLAVPAEGYVDLAALIFEDDEDASSTRFVVPDEEPSGDEDRDFSEMLAQFKQKVSENIAAEDSTSHYDLGLAFKDMGLLDEAIAQFQVALRGGAQPLATLEVLGECFIEKAQYSLAGRVLERALKLPDVSEADLTGVFYWLARCEEAMNRGDRARDYLERVLASDIRFRDAAARLEGLRSGS